MNKIAKAAILMAAALAMACGMSLSAHAQANGAKQTLTGMVTDAMCGKAHDMKGMSDADCTRMCVKGGSAFGLIVGDKVYTLRGNSSALNKYAAQKVTVSGTMHDGALLVESVKPAR